MTNIPNGVMPLRILKINILSQSFAVKTKNYCIPGAKPFVAERLYISAFGFPKHLILFDVILCLVTLVTNTRKMHRLIAVRHLF